MYEKDVDYVLPVVKKEKETQNKNSKMLFIFIAVAVVAIIAGVIGSSYFFPKSINGDWELTVNPEIAQATPDEIKDEDRVYYTFSEPSKYGDGTYKTYYAGGVEEGTYKLSEKDGKELINLGTEDLEYKITGSKLLSNAKLTITYPEYTNEETGQKVPAEDYGFEQSKAPKYENESYDSFSTDKTLVNKWTSNERTLAYYMYDLSYTETVEFFDNGIMTIHYESSDLALNRYMYYAYTTDKGKLTFSLVTDKDTKYSVTYDFDENGNLIFTEDSTSASIFADAFFSTVTYYTPDNLPEESAENTSATEK